MVLICRHYSKSHPKCSNTGNDSHIEELPKIPVKVGRTELIIPLYQELIPPKTDDQGCTPKY